MGPKIDGGYLERVTTHKLKKCLKAVSNFFNTAERINSIERDYRPRFLASKIEREKLTSAVSSENKQLWIHLRKHPELLWI